MKTDRIVPIRVTKVLCRIRESGVANMLDKPVVLAYVRFFDKHAYQWIVLYCGDNYSRWFDLMLKIARYSKEPN